VKVIIEKTRRTNDTQIDINYLDLQRFSNPIIIATREGQVHRILEWVDRTGYKGKFTVTGWWNLNKHGYVCVNGLIESRWKDHDAAFFLDPARCSSPDLYTHIISFAQSV
jgi:hypothetical protein